MLYCFVVWMKEADVAPLKHTQIELLSEYGYLCLHHCGQIIFEEVLWNALST